jgi:DNA-binding XRE family transcriptional regulator
MMGEAAMEYDKQVPGWAGEQRAKRHPLLLPRAIRSAREKRDWTQAELAARLDVSQATISFWERGIETPSLRHQVLLVSALPEVFEQLAELESEILARLYRLERALNDGKCRCHGCDCDL